MKLSELGIGLVVLVVAVAFAFEAGRRSAPPGEPSPAEEVPRSAPLSPTLSESPQPDSTQRVEAGLSSIVAIETPAQPLPEPKPVEKPVPIAGDGAFYGPSDSIADRDLNPEGKSLDRFSSERLKALLDELNQAVRSADDAYDTQRSACFDQKLAARDFESVEMGQPGHPSPGAVASMMRVDREGAKWVELFPNEYPALDEAARLKDEVRADRREQVRNWFAHH
jgi:hypothetical protein